VIELKLPMSRTEGEAGILRLLTDLTIVLKARPQGAFVNSFKNGFCTPLPPILPPPPQPFSQSIHWYASLAQASPTCPRSDLQGLVPEKARLELGGGGAWREVPTEALAAGDVLLVLPGDKFPVDGVVVSGTSSCNEAALTGEPMPVSQGPGTFSQSKGRRHRSTE